MVAHGQLLTPASRRQARLAETWAELDSDRSPIVVWPRPVSAAKTVVLLGAFDPPTRAHVAVLEAAIRTEGGGAALCMTRKLLARSADELLPVEERLRLVDTIAEARSFGFALANRGTYIDVHRAMRSSGVEATFLVGSDKVAQLADPSFYPDGRQGVDATFSEVDLLVVPRAGVDVELNDLRVLEPGVAFDDAALASLSSTEVRRRMRAGVDVSDLVPPEVAVDLGGYTAAK